MSSTRERVYQTTDLSGAARKEFLEAGRNGRAYLRTPEGDSLVLTRTAHLDLLSQLRDYMVAYVMLDSALARPRGDRRAADFGEWAFLSTFADEGIEEFRTEINDVIMRAVSGHDVSVIDATLAEWRRSARAFSDPLTRSLILGPRDAEDFVDARSASAPMG